MSCAVPTRGIRLGTHYRVKETGKKGREKPNTRWYSNTRPLITMRALYCFATTTAQDILTSNWSYWYLGLRKKIQSCGKCAKLLLFELSCAFYYIVFPLMTSLVAIIYVGNEKDKITIDYSNLQ